MAGGQIHENINMGVDYAEHHISDIKSPKTLTVPPHSPTSLRASVFEKLKPISPEDLVGLSLDSSLPKNGGKARSRDILNCIAKSNGTFQKLPSSNLGIKSCAGSHQLQTATESNGDKHCISAFPCAEVVKAAKLRNGPPAWDALVAPGIGNMAQNARGMSGSPLLTSLPSNQHEKMVTLNLEPVPHSQSNMWPPSMWDTAEKQQPAYNSVTYTVMPNIQRRNCMKEPACNTANVSGTQRGKAHNTSSFMQKLSAVKEKNNALNTNFHLKNAIPRRAVISRNVTEIYSESKFSASGAMVACASQLFNSRKRKYCNVSETYIRYLNKPKQARHEPLKLIFKSVVSLVPNGDIPQSPTKQSSRFNDRIAWPTDKIPLPGCVLKMTKKTGRCEAPPSRRRKSTTLSKYRVPKPKRRFHPVTSAPVANHSKLARKEQFLRTDKLIWDEKNKKFIIPANKSNILPQTFPRKQCFSFPATYSASALYKKYFSHRSGEFRSTSSSQGLKFGSQSFRKTSTVSHSRPLYTSSKSPVRITPLPQRLRDMKAILKCVKEPEPAQCETISDYMRVCVMFQVRTLLAARALAVSQSVPGNENQSNGTPQQMAVKLYSAVNSHINKKEVTPSQVLIASQTEQSLMNWTKFLPDAESLDIIHNPNPPNVIKGKSPDKKPLPRWLYNDEEPTSSIDEWSDDEDNDVLCQQAAVAWHCDDFYAGEMSDDETEKSGRLETINSRKEPAVALPALSPQRILSHKPLHIKKEQGYQSTNGETSLLKVTNQTEGGCYSKTLQSQSKVRTINRDKASIRKHRCVRPVPSYCVRYRSHFGTYDCFCDRMQFWVDCPKSKIIEHPENDIVPFRSASENWEAMDCDIDCKETSVTVFPCLNNGSLEENASESVHGQNCASRDQSHSSNCSPSNSLYLNTKKSYFEQYYGKCINDLAHIAWLADSLLGLEKTSAVDKNITVTDKTIISDYYETEQGPDKDCRTSLIFPPKNSAICALKNDYHIRKLKGSDCLYSQTKHHLSLLAKTDGKRKKICATINMREQLCEKEKEKGWPVTRVNNLLPVHSEEGNTGTVTVKEIRQAEQESPASKREKLKNCSAPLIGCSTNSKTQYTCSDKVGHKSGPTLDLRLSDQTGTKTNCDLVTEKEMGNLLCKTSLLPDLPVLLQPDIKFNVSQKDNSNCRGAFVKEDSATAISTPDTNEFSSKMGRDSSIRGQLKQKMSELSKPVDVSNHVSCNEASVPSIISKKNERRNEKKNTGQNMEAISECPKVDDQEGIKEENGANCNVKGSEVWSSNRLRAKRTGVKRGRYEEDYVTDLPKNVKKPKKALPCRDYDQDKFWEFYRKCQDSDHSKNLVLQCKYIKFFKQKEINCKVQPLNYGPHSFTCTSPSLQYGSPNQPKPTVPIDGYLPFMKQFTKAKKPVQEPLKSRKDGHCPYCGRSFGKEAKNVLDSHIARHMMGPWKILSAPRLSKKKKKKKSGRGPSANSKPSPKTTVVFVNSSENVKKDSRMNEEKPMVLTTSSMKPGQFMSSATHSTSTDLDQLKNIKAFPRPSNISMGHRKQTARKSHSNLARNLSKEKLIEALSASCKNGKLPLSPFGSIPPVVKSKVVWQGVGQKMKEPETTSKPVSSSAKVQTVSGLPGDFCFKGTEDTKAPNEKPPVPSPTIFSSSPNTIKKINKPGPSQRRFKRKSSIGLSKYAKDTSSCIPSSDVKSKSGTETALPKCEKPFVANALNNNISDNKIKVINMNNSIPDISLPPKLLQRDLERIRPTSTQNRRPNQNNY